MNSTRSNLFSNLIHNKGDSHFMYFMNDTTFDYIPRKTPAKDPHMFEIDENMAPVIKLLNEKGYKTEFCCEGHYGKMVIGDIEPGDNRCRNSAAYIKFDSSITNLPSLPKDWYIQVKYLIPHGDFILHLMSMEEHEPYIDFDDDEHDMHFRIDRDHIPAYEFSIHADYHGLEGSDKAQRFDAQRMKLQSLMNLMDWVEGLPAYKPIPHTEGAINKYFDNFFR